jgi:DNA-binding MarR family transcriptional regulator
MGLSAGLSQLLVAFTIEFDNEFEQRMAHRTAASKGDRSRGPWLTSMAMWANFMRYVPADGAPLGELDGLARMTNLGGLDRWGYIDVGPATGDRGPKPRPDWIVRPTRAGRRAQETWGPLAGLVEERWRDRFGADRIGRLRDALEPVHHEVGAGLPRYLPVVNFADGMRTGELTPAGRIDEPDLSVLLAQALLVFTVDFERESKLSLPITADVVRVIPDEGARVRDLPRLGGISKEAVAASLGFLERRGYAEVGPDPAGGRGKLTSLTDQGRRVRNRYPRLVDLLDGRWTQRFGGGLAEVVSELLRHRDGDSPTLARGLQPYPDGWRARTPYLTQTRAVLADPASALPQHPMVLHRGGYPDGS